MTMVVFIFTFRILLHCLFNLTHMGGTTSVPPNVLGEGDDCIDIGTLQVSNAFWYPNLMLPFVYNYDEYVIVYVHICNNVIVYLSFRLCTYAFTILNHMGGTTLVPPTCLDEEVHIQRNYVYMPNKKYKFYNGTGNGID